MSKKGLCECGGGQLAPLAERNVSRIKLAALDLSLVGTAICHPDGTTERIDAPANKIRGVERLVAIRRRVMAVCRECDVVGLEGYAFAKNDRGARSTGELGGVIRVALHDYGVPFVEIPPSNRMLYATGKGRADKDLVLSAAVRRTNRDMNNDEADAWWLHQMMLAHYDPANPLLVKMPALHLKALEKIQWVDLTIRGLS